MALARNPFPKNIQQAKNGPQEIRYIRLLQADKKLRNHLKKIAGTVYSDTNRL